MIFRKKGKEPKDDLMTFVVRQRRAIRAWDDIMVRPGFTGIFIRHRKFNHWPMLDERRDAIDRDAGQQRVVGTAALADALLASLSEAPDITVDAHVNDHPIARWARVPLGPMLKGLGTQLATLPAGFVLMTDEDLVVIADPDPSGDFRLTVIGDWPEPFAAALLS